MCEYSVIFILALLSKYRVMTIQQLRYVVPITRIHIVCSTVTNLTEEKS